MYELHSQSVLTGAGLGEDPISLLSVSDPFLEDTPMDFLGVREAGMGRSREESSSMVIVI